MSDGVIVIDAQNRLVDINPAAEQVLELSKKSRIGQPVGSLFSTWPEILAAFRDVRETHTVISIGDPPNRFFDLNISPLYGDHRRFLGRLVVWRDITLLKKAQADLQEQAVRDALTGLYNRRYLDETLEREMAHAMREGQPISFAMLDIDHFKSVNDNFGHHEGDVVLQKLATLLLSHTRVGDIVCRYGGEEFLIVLPDVTAAIAFQIAERWRRSFVGLTMPLEPVGVKVTLSCGISEFPTHGMTKEELISIADQALYHAKETGRNRVIIWRKGWKGWTVTK
jgi:diguanylate cyclase (GGDEF)-like protein